MCPVKSEAMPLPSLRRVFIYYRCVNRAVQNGDTYLSSYDLGLEEGASPEQMRKDLSYLTASQGRSRVGYASVDLAAAIKDYLDLMNDQEAFLVGVGRLEKALALYPGFAQYG